MTLIMTLALAVVFTAKVIRVTAFVVFVLLRRWHSNAVCPLSSVILL